MYVCIGTASLCRYKMVLLPFDHSIMDMGVSENGVYRNDRFDRGNGVLKPQDEMGHPIFSAKSISSNA